jgi:hypothetical protein
LETTLLEAALSTPPISLLETPTPSDKRCVGINKRAMKNNISK